MKMDFGDAFCGIKFPDCATGMRLPNWSKDVRIKVQYPTPESKMTAPYFYVDSQFGVVPWIPTMIELFSEDWEIR